MNRGVDRMSIFTDERDRRIFLRCLQEMSRKHPIQTVAYCMVGNHYHLVLHCPVGGLARAMHKLGADYARTFNRRHGRDGPLCKSRYTSRLVEDDGYLAHLLAYVHSNSLDLGVSPSAWPWSSFNAYIGNARAPSWLYSEQALEIAGGRRAHQEAVDGFDDRRSEVRSAREQLVRIESEVGQRGSHLSSRQRADLTLIVAASSEGASVGELAPLLGLKSRQAVHERVRRAKERSAASEDMVKLLDSLIERPAA